MRRDWQISVFSLASPFLVAAAVGCGTQTSLVGKPDFTLSTSATSVSLTPGGATQSVTLTATALNGFSGTIQVTVGGLPTGVTATPATITLAVGVPQKVSFAAAATATAGSATAQFAATAGTLSHTAPITLDIAAAAKPDFTLTASATSLTLTAGGAAQSVMLTATAVNGFTGSIGVKVSGLPAGVITTPATITLAVGVPQKVSFTAAATTPSGTATAQFLATAGTLSHSVPIALNVTAVAKPDFTLTTSVSSLTLAAGGSAKSVTLTATAVNGFTGTIQVKISGLPTGVTTTPATITLAVGVPQKISFTAAATTSSGTATVQFVATAGKLSHSVPIALNVTAASKPDFTLSTSVSSLTLTAGGSAQSVTLTATAVNGFTGTIQVKISGLPTGVTATPAAITLAVGVPQKVSFTAAATTSSGTATAQFVATAGTLSHSVPITLNITAAAKPDFTLTTSVSSLTLTAGGSAQSVTLSATAVNGFTGTVQVKISGLPTGVTATPASLTLAIGIPQKVSFAAAATAAAGTTTAHFVATAGTLSHSVPITLNITAAAKPDFTLTASPTSLTLTPGGSAQSVTLTANAVNGFSASIEVAISGLPTGVTATPASLTLAVGVPQKVSLAAAATATASSSTVKFVGTAGTLSHSASITLTVASATPGRDVVTYHYDVGRTGLNANETALTTSNVTSAKFGLVRVLQVDGVVDAQPLYLANLTAGGQQRNVVFTETEHDSVYAFDADTGAQIWKASVLGANETPSGDHGCGQISPEIGITSTPVIDRQAGPNGTIFVVGMSLDQSGAYHQRLHALDVATGAELTGSPTEIHATYPGIGSNSSGGNVIFDPAQYAERAGLLLLNGVIYLGWTSHCDAEPYTGWVMGYSETTLAQTTVLNVTPNGAEGSIWMAGAGLAADSSGNIYFLDANGVFDTTLDANGFPSQHDYGNGFLKISTAGGKLKVADYFEMDNTTAESNADEDLGSGGALVLPDLTDTSGTVHHLAVGAGKDGQIYIANRDNMGKFNPSNNSAVYQQIAGGGGGVWAMPAYFNNTVYYGAVGDNLKAYPITNARFATSPSVQSTTSFEYPGTTPAVSADGTANGIVWAVENSSPAVLHAYDATTLQELYNSSQAAGGRDQFGSGNKFITPMIVNGKVFVGTPSGVAVFGLLQ